MPATPTLRREQIKLQVALITPLIHVNGHAAPETKAAVEHARVLIEQAEALGERPEDPLLLFSVLYGFWVANFIASNYSCSPSKRNFLTSSRSKHSAILPAYTHASVCGGPITSGNRGCFRRFRRHEFPMRSDRCPGSGLLPRECRA